MRRGTTSQSALRPHLRSGSPERRPDDYIVLPDLVLDLDALAEEDVVLNLPSKVLCKDDCKGLCPQCGKNLNDGPCDCKEPVDPRLAGLLELLN